MIEVHRKAQEVRVWNDMFFDHGTMMYQILIAQPCVITIFIYSDIYMALQNIFWNHQNIDWNHLNTMVVEFHQKK